MKLKNNINVNFDYLALKDTFKIVTQKIKKTSRRNN